MFTLNHLNEQMKNIQENQVVQYVDSFIEALEEYHSVHPEAQRVMFREWGLGVNCQDLRTAKGSPEPGIRVRFILGTMEVYIQAHGDRFFGVVRKGARYNQRRSGRNRNEYSILSPAPQRKVGDFSKFIDLIVRIDGEHEDEAVSRYTQELDNWFLNS